MQTPGTYSQIMLLMFRENLTLSIIRKQECTVWVTASGHAERTENKIVFDSYVMYSYMQTYGVAVMC